MAPHCVQVWITVWFCAADGSRGHGLGTTRFYRRALVTAIKYLVTRRLLCIGQPGVWSTRSMVNPKYGQPKSPRRAPTAVRHQDCSCVRCRSNALALPRFKPPERAAWPRLCECGRNARIVSPVGAMLGWRAGFALVLVSSCLGFCLASRRIAGRAQHLWPTPSPAGAGR